MEGHAFGCVRNTIKLRSGKYFDLADPRPDQFDFADIAGALSKICRFGGQCEFFYSVAEHSYHCALQAKDDGMPLETQAAVLMHDAAEAFVGDMVKPLKVMLPDFGKVERAVEAAIAEKFLIDFEREAAVIKEIDRAMLIAERRAMFGADDILWAGENEVRRLVGFFQKWTPVEAETRFVRLARAIGISVKAS